MDEKKHDAQPPVPAKEVTAEKVSRLKKPRDKKFFGISIAVFVIGLAGLVSGLVFMLINLFTEPGLREADYLVSIGEWVKQDEPSVIWKFTEIGKGTLTTNNHINDYDFIWALDGNTLKIETDWLYDLNDEFTYTLNKDTGKLMLNEDMTFVPLVTDTN